jgi:hypothetical protein
MTDTPLLRRSLHEQIARPTCEDCKKHPVDGYVGNIAVCVLCFAKRVCR